MPATASCASDASPRRAVAAAYGADIAPAGHAVVRVAPGGGEFRVFTVSADDEEMTVLSERSFASRRAV